MSAPRCKSCGRLMWGYPLQGGGIAVHFTKTEAAIVRRLLETANSAHPKIVAEIIARIEAAAETKETDE